MAHKTDEHQLIIHTQPKSPMAEAYRTLRTNLGFARPDERCRTIMVTSTNPGEGKSTTISNLAVAMAQAGSKTILVDCDLRKPVMHKIFGVDNLHGFTNCLLKNMDIEDAAYHGLVENLTLLTSGPIPPNPAEILNAERTEKFWSQLLVQYEYVFIDTPPVLAVTDASIVASQVDGVILVVRSAETRKDLAREASEQLRKANAHILGVVLNQVKINSRDSQYYYYYSQDDSKSARKIRL